MHAVDYRKLFETTPAGVVLQDANGMIFDANPAAERILGLTLDQMQGRAWSDPRWRAIGEDGAPLPTESDPAMIALRDGVEVYGVMMGVFNPARKHVSWIRVSAVPIFANGGATPNQVYATFEDVTAQHLYMEAEHYQRNLAETLRDILAVLTTFNDMEEALRLILTLVERVVQYDVASIYLVERQGASLKYQQTVKGSGYKLDVPDSILWSLPRLRAVIEHGKAYWVDDVTAADDWVPLEGIDWIRSSIGVPISGHGRILGVLALEHSMPGHFRARDIEALDTFSRYVGLALERIAQTTETLRASDERWQFALEGAGDGIRDWNIATGEVSYSKGWNAILGFADSEMENTIEAWQSRVHPDDLERVLAELAAHLNGDTPILWSEHRVLASDGSYRWVLDRGKVVERDADGRPLRFIGVYSDITERRRIETELSRQSELLQILMGTALTFINLPIEQLDQAIVDVLGSVGAFNHSDRAYIFDYDFDRGVLYNTYEWCAEGIEPQIDVLSEPMPIDLFPEWVSAHVRKMPAHYPDVSALDETDPLRLVLEPQGIQSVITIPLIDQERCRGFVGFDAVREKRLWSETDITLLKLLAELIVNAKLRLHHEKLLAQTTVELQLSEMRLRNAQRIARLGAWEYDVATHQVMWSPEVFRIFGLAPATVLDVQAVFARLHEADRPLLAGAMNRAITEGKPYELELRVIRPDGEIVYTLSQGEPEVDASHQTVRLIGAVLDITERKKGEIALQNALEREKELNELKSRFVAMASHELRTPLATILAAAETLLAYGDRLEAGQMERRLNKIRERVEHLQAIIGDVLQLTRIEAGTQQFNPEIVELDAFCADIVSDWRERIKDRHLFYRSSGAALMVNLDRQLLRQAIDNIIGNAVKYSFAQSEIQVEVGAADGVAVIAVHDQGIGIPENSFKHLFEPFYRAPNATMIPGTGLGLAIVREILTLHEGEINIESRVGENTTASIRIPLETKE